jgi:site-specific DNA recombinase
LPKQARSGRGLWFDRLTRSLADFAKLVEPFDAHDVSFVSVTQQFNTTKSMGRLILNVLLSFAQFEREVTSERIRDKIAASKRKGIWVGGPLPLGYALKDGALVVVADEAERVRLIFRRYLKVSGINELARDLEAKNICTKARTLRTTGNTRGGIPFGGGALSHLLRNRFFEPAQCSLTNVALISSLKNAALPNWNAFAATAPATVAPVADYNM